jgi:hypothetical protein
MPQDEDDWEISAHSPSETHVQIDERRQGDVLVLDLHGSSPGATATY